MSNIIFNQHNELIGCHAFISPSQHARFHYDEEKLIKTYNNLKQVELGTELHVIAKELIDHAIKLPKTRATLNMYVNDAIGYHLTTEQPLYYSPFCFGTADSIGFKKNFLRIHDFKSGTTPASMEQLEGYAALFFLEYGDKYKISPKNVDMELRIYQSNEVIVENPEPDVIQDLMDYIVWADCILSKIN